MLLKFLRSQIQSSFLTIFIVALTFVSVGVNVQAEPKTVTHVDVSRYLGDWYQISHVPLFFEGGRCACGRQRLTLGTKGVVNVFNSCNASTPQGKLRTISGTATNDDPVSNSKFTVDFGLIQKGTYWIVGLDPKYRFAVVTDRGSYSLYILAKTPTLSPSLYKQAVAFAQAQNLKVGDLEMTEQAGCTYPADNFDDQESI